MSTPSGEPANQPPANNPEGASTQQQEPPAPPTGSPAPPAGDSLGDGGKKALDDERKARRDAEKRAKDAEQAARDLDARLRAIEDKDKTELEKAQSKITRLEKDHGSLSEKYATEQAQRLRLQVATEHGVSKDDLVLLTATTEDELVAQAKRIAELNEARGGAKPPAFASNPGQTAGNAHPPSATATVAAGRELYRKQHNKT